MPEKTPPVSPSANLARDLLWRDVDASSSVAAEERPVRTMAFRSGEQEKRVSDEACTVSSEWRGRARSLAACAVIIFAAIGCHGLPFRRGIEVPNVQIADVTPLEGPGLIPRARVDLTLSNPNNVPLEINGMRLQLDFNDLRLATGQTDQVVALPRLGEAPVSIVLTSSLTDLLRQLSGLRPPGLLRRFFLGRRSFGYEIRGDLFLTNPENRTLHFRSSSSQ